MQEELEYYRSHAENLEATLQDTRLALDEFQLSSRELEEELEKELQTTEKAYKDLKSRCEHFKYEADEWKVCIYNIPFFFLFFKKRKYLFKDIYIYIHKYSQNIHKPNMNKTCQPCKCNAKLIS